MQYAELSAAIQSYTENTFPGTTISGSVVVTQKQQIDTFIKQAEQRIYNTVQFPSLRRNVVGATTQGRPYIQAPQDFLAVYSMAIVDENEVYTYLLPKDVNYIREAYPNPNAQGIPRLYALFGPTVVGNFPNGVATNELSFIVGPTPDQRYTVQLHYFYYPTSIVDDPSGRSWLGDNFDSVLLYGSLVEAYTYMKGEEDVLKLYEGKYKEALALAKRLGDGMERSDAYRNRQYRQPVN